MFSKARKWGLSGSQWTSVAVLASAVGIAGAVSLTTFTAGTQISASAVNANFAALNNALPQVWASVDTTPGGITVPTTSVAQTVNTVSINAPASGHLIISGTLYVNNSMTSSLYFNLNPQVDGVSVNNGPFMAAAKVPADAVAGDAMTLTYTTTTTVTAGAHTVSQQVWPGTLTNPGVPTSATYFYNRNSLTVVFVPSISGFTALEAQPSGPTSSRGEYGF